MDEIEQLERAGAVARAAGTSRFDSPLYAAERMPGSTGQSVKDWQDRASAWERGWVIEDAIRYRDPLAALIEALA